MSRDYYYQVDDQFCACDVSQISEFPDENQILVARDSKFRIFPSNSTQIDKNQYILCHCDNDTQYSFQKVFMVNQIDAFD